MEGYLNLRIQPWVRRIITRLIPLYPPLLLLLFWRRSDWKLLIFSQVILSLQLGFAVIPLIHFVSDKTK
jgi:manganese transport protein